MWQGGSAGFVLSLLPLACLPVFCGLVVVVGLLMRMQQIHVVDASACCCGGRYCSCITRAACCVSQMTGRRLQPHPPNTQARCMRRTTLWSSAVWHMPNASVCDTAPPARLASCDAAADKTAKSSKKSRGATPSSYIYMASCSQRWHGVAWYHAHHQHVTIPLVQTATPQPTHGALLCAAQQYRACRTAACMHACLCTCVCAGGAACVLYVLRAWAA